jgi:hypothetical protein
MCDCASMYNGTLCQFDVNECATNNAGCESLSVWYGRARSLTSLKLLLTYRVYVLPARSTNTFGGFFCSAFIQPATLRSTQPVLSLNPIVLASTSAGRILRFQAVGKSQSIASMTFTAGPSGDPTRTTCTTALIAPLNNQNQTVQCTLGAGCGLNYRIWMWNGTLLVHSTDLFHYPSVTLTPGTLRSSSAQLPPSASLTPAFSNAITVQFSGNYFCPEFPALMNIRYGTSAYPNSFSCALDPLLTNSTVLSCQTQDFSSGRSMRFRVIVGDTTVNSTDTLSLPETPLINRVSSLSCQDGTNSTRNCPTAGNVTITIYGSSLYNPLTVLIGGQPCGSVLAANDALSATCILPPGTGVLGLVNVQAINIGKSSPLYKLLGYALPSISSLQAPGNCTSSAGPLSLLDCNRAGGVLTVNGANFGASNARVLIGADLCTNVRQNPANPHSQLTCTFAAGTELLRPLLVLQGDGAVGTTTAFVSFVQCQPGWRQSGALCTPWYVPPPPAVCSCVSTNDAFCFFVFCRS